MNDEYIKRNILRRQMRPKWRIKKKKIKVTKRYERKDELEKKLHCMQRTTEIIRCRKALERIADSLEYFLQEMDEETQKKNPYHKMARVAERDEAL